MYVVSTIIWVRRTVQKYLQYKGGGYHVTLNSTRKTKTKMTIDIHCVTECRTD